MTTEQPRPARVEPTPVDPAPDPRRWKALGVLAVSLGLIVLDGSIVSVALPAIIGDLGLDITDAQWVNSLYAVVFSALLLISGRLGDRVGRRTMLVIGVVVFTLASLGAGLAGSGTTLLLARLAQGIGGALIMPSTLSTVNAMFRGKERAAAFGVWGAVMSGAAALGPLLGGWLTSEFSWRWIFFVNLPIGAAVVIGAMAWVADTRERGAALDGGAGRPMPDVLGAVLSGLGLGLLVFGIIESSSLGWFRQKEPLRILGASIDGPGPLSVVPVVLALSVVLLAAFLLLEARRRRQGREVLLDLRLFSIPAFRWGNLTAGTVAIGEFGLLFVLPLYLVDVRGLGTMRAGLVLAAMALGAFVAGASARHLAARLGAARTVVLGLALEVAGVAALGLLLSPTTSFVLVVGVLVVYGLGLGLASAQLTSTVLADVPTDESGQGSATQSTVRQLGTALGASISGALLSAGLVRGSAGLTGSEAHMADAVRESAGSALVTFREQGVPAETLSTLASTFSDAARMSVLGAGAFLLLGLLGALQVARVSGRDPRE
ncbi:MFS transporter [Brachybacterium huguangmaarense]